MTYEQLKQKVAENDLGTSKDARNVVLSLALGIFFYAIGIFIGTAILWNTFIALLTFVLASFLFIFALDYICEEKETFIKWQKYLKFWWTGIIFDVLVFVILYLLNYI